MGGLGWGAFAACVLLCASGCTTTRAPVGGQCELNTECQNPLVCRLTRCRVACATNRDCQVGSICVLDEQKIGACRLPDESFCGRDSDCAGVLVCRGEQCTNECVEHRDCAAGSRCDETMSCIDVANTLCIYDSECEEAGLVGLACATDGRCRDECVEDRDCRQGAYCNDAARCEENPLPTDAGMDTAVDAVMDTAVDAPVDASDAGMDSGPPRPLCPGGSATECVAVAGSNARFDCLAGVCTITQCTPRDTPIMMGASTTMAAFTDCDGLFENGCESYLSTDVNNCGACGTVCGAGEVCAGRCVAGSVAQLELGHHISCLRFSSGEVACWGSNRFGQMGDGTDLFVSPRYIAPFVTPGVTNVVDLAVGPAQGSGTDESHVCALRSDGTVMCWGKNDSGQAGAAPSLGQTAPIMVPSLTDAVEISAGDSFTCARRMGGTVSCWGEQQGGRLGNGMDTMASISTPGAVSSLTGATGLASTNGPFACAATGATSYRCWGTAGSNGSGLGAGDLGIGGRAPTPIVATALTGLGLTDLDGSQNVMFGIDGSGDVHCWGRSLQGDCGPTDFTMVATPYRYTDFTGAVEVAAGRTVMARLSSGALRCWGADDMGQCGQGSLTGINYTPLAVPGITDATLVAVGGFHSCIVRSGGGVWCTGNNSFGQLGNGREMSTETSFVRVVGVP